MGGWDGATDITSTRCWWREVTPACSPVTWLRESAWKYHRKCQWFRERLQQLTGLFHNPLCSRPPLTRCSILPGSLSRAALPFTWLLWLIGMKSLPGIVKTRFCLEAKLSFFFSSVYFSGCTEGNCYALWELPATFTKKITLPYGHPLTQGGGEVFPSANLNYNQRNVNKKQQQQQSCFLELFLLVAGWGMEVGRGWWGTF